jgi:hypothetical protein
MAQFKDGRSKKMGFFGNGKRTGYNVPTGCNGGDTPVSSFLAAAARMQQGVSRGETKKVVCAAHEAAQTTARIQEQAAAVRATVTNAQRRQGAEEQIARDVTTLVGMYSTTTVSDPVSTAPDPTAAPATPVDPAATSPVDPGTSPT